MLVTLGRGPPDEPASVVREFREVFMAVGAGQIHEHAARSPCYLRLTHPGVRRTGCGRSSGAPTLAPTGHPAWTHVFRAVFQTAGGRRPRRTALTGRPEPSAWPVPPRRPDGLTPPGACTDDGGLRPWGSRRSCRRQGAPP